MISQNNTVPESCFDSELKNKYIESRQESGKKNTLVICGILTELSRVESEYKTPVYQMPNGVICHALTDLRLFHMDECAQYVSVIRDYSQFVSQKGIPTQNIGVIHARDIDLIPGLYLHAIPREDILCDYSSNLFSPLRKEYVIPLLVYHEMTYDEISHLRRDSVSDDGTVIRLPGRIVCLPEKSAKMLRKHMDMNECESALGDRAVMYSPKSEYVIRPTVVVSAQEYDDYEESEDDCVVSVPVSAGAIRSAMFRFFDKVYNNYKKELTAKSIAFSGKMERLRVARYIPGRYVDDSYCGTNRGYDYWSWCKFIESNPGTKTERSDSLCINRRK